MTSLLIVGDSHIYAIKDALRGKPVVPDDVVAEALRLCAEKNGERIGDIEFDALLSRVKGLSQDDLVVTMLRGNQFNTIGLMQHPLPFDALMHCVDGGLTRQGAELIPVQLLRDYFQQTLTTGYGRMLIEVMESSGAPVACVATPPPKEDAHHILAHAETYFRERGISGIGVTPASTRLKLWVLQHEALRNFCAKNGLMFVPAPGSARDESGYLLREYYADDATHGNRAYGRLVLRQLTAILKRNPPPAQ